MLKHYGRGMISYWTLINFSLNLKLNFEKWNFCFYSLIKKNKKPHQLIYYENLGFEPLKIS